MLSQLEENNAVLIKMRMFGNVYNFADVCEKVCVKFLSIQGSEGNKTILS